jgi:oligogalacturonide lyase
VRTLSRRDFLAVAAIGHLSGPEWKRYPDPATEWQVLRLTDPAFASGMTAPHLRQFTRRSESLIYWSERAGTPQAFLLDLKAGGSEQLTDASALDGKTLAISSDDREFYYFSGPSLYASLLLSIRPREIHRIPEDSVRSGFAVGADGSIYLAEGKEGNSRISAILRQQVRKVADIDGEITDLMPRPRRAQLMYRSGGQLWLVNTDGSNRRALKTEPGQTGQALWTPLGRTITYLHVPDDPKVLITLREHSPDDNTDRLLAKTSQFTSASPNADASVFAGASRSAGSAYVLILLRVAHRELTLCEHHASDPLMVNPVFSPDSKSVLFVSDRHGKPAIYLVSVVKFVEETGGDATQ